MRSHLHASITRAQLYDDPNAIARDLLFQANDASARNKASPASLTPTEQHTTIPKFGLLPRAIAKRAILDELTPPRRANEPSL